MALVKVRSAAGEPRWVLPKGWIEEGESAEAAALREVREETGYDVVSLGPAGDVEYWFVWDGERRHKKVRFFLMSIIGGDPSRHDAEVEEVALFPAEEAASAMAFANERTVLHQALTRAIGSDEWTAGTDAAPADARHTR